MNIKYLAKAHSMLSCTRLAIDECIALMQGAEGEDADVLFGKLVQLTTIRATLIEMLREEERK